MFFIPANETWMTRAWRFVRRPRRLAACAALLLSLGAAVRGGEPPPDRPAASAVRILEQAVSYLRRMDYGGAKALIATGLEASPFYIPLWLAKAKAEIGLGDRDAAEEALGVVLEAEPDNAEANILAFQTIFDPDGVSDPQKCENLVRRMQTLDSGVFRAVIMEALLSAPDMALKLDSFLSAWRAADVTPDALYAVLEGYARQEFVKAAKILASPAADELPGDLAGALNLALGRILPWVNEPREALERLARAKALGFEEAEADRLAGLIHLAGGEPAKAASALEKAWRGADRPADVALDAAVAYLAAGEADRAVRLIESAQRAYPDHAGLQGRKLLILRRLGGTMRFAAYEAELKAGDAVPGLMYYRILSAWENGDFDGYARETAAMREYLDRYKGEYMTLISIDNWIRFGDWIKSSNDVAAYQKLRDVSDRLWSMGRHADAVVVLEGWSAFDSPLRNISLYNMALALLDREMAPQAEALLARNIPEIGGMDLAVHLYDAGLLSAAYRIFKSVDAKEADSPWATLYLAAIAVRTDEREDARRYLAELWNLSPPPPLHVKSIGEDDGIAVTALPYSVFRTLALETAEQAVRNGAYGDTYDAMVRAPILREPGPDGEDQTIRLAALMVRIGQRDEARRIVEPKLAGDPADSGANLWMALAEYGDRRPEEAERRLAAGMPAAGDATREYLLAWRSRLAADREGTAEHLLKAVELNPADPHVRGEAIQALVDAHRYADARDLVRPFEIQYARNDTDIGSFLAAAYVATGRLAQAEPILNGLVRRFPYSRVPLASLGDVLNRLGQPRKTIKALAAAARGNGDPEYAALLAEAHLALGEGREALDWVETGLGANPRDVRLLRLGAQAAEIEADHALIERYAGEFIAIDPESSAMHNLYGQALLDQKKWEDLRRHSAGLFQTNPRNIGAMEREAEWAKALADPKMAAREAWEMDKRMLRLYENDPSLVIRGSISAASDSDFRFAIPTLRRMLDLGPNSVVQSVYFGRIATGDVLGGVPVSEAREKLEALYERHCHAPIEALTSGPNPMKEALLKIPLVVFVGRSTAADLEEFDAYLAENAGRAVLVAGEESLADGTAVWPDAGFLRTLAATGRWQFVLTDYSPLMLPARDGAATGFWLQAKWLGDRFETREEMRQRLSGALAGLKAKAEAAGIPVSGWVHPSWGDYGQRALRQTSSDEAAYLDAVREHFNLAMTMVPGGYRVPTTDHLRIPMRAIGAGLDTGAFIDSVHWNHPTRRSVLELAKAKSWHGQLPAARDLFLESRTMNLDAREIAYFQARNAEYEGDVPSAVDGAHEAFRLDPENPRTQDLMDDAHRLMRPLLTLDPTYAVDSDNERHAGVTATLSWHVSKKLELRVLGGVHRWWNDDGRTQGVAAGAGARYYFAPQNWILGEIKGVAADGGVGSYPEGRLQWHGAYNLDRFFRTNGFFDLSYNREAEQTRQAMAAGGIFADRFSAGTTARICNWWEVDASAGVISRTDGNTTWETSFRPTYRIFDSPLLRLGYWFTAADSKFDPPEYYAPENSVSHSAVALFRYSLTPEFVLTGLGAYGYGRSGDSGWHEIFRANLGANWRINDCVDLSGGWQYLKLPDYWLHQFSASVNIRF